MATDDHQEEEGVIIDTSILPYDIVHDILLRLPLKSMLKFKSVCKSWKAMITSTQFTQTHLQNHNNLFLHISLDPSDYHKPYVYSSVKLQRGLINKFQFESKLESPVRRDTVLCTCQGVALLTDHSCDNYMLWNPSTRQHDTFVCPYRYDGLPVYHGLFHDPKTDDFKVVVACDQKYYAVYSCKNKSWTGRMDFGYKFNGMSGTEIGVFVDGVMYWVVTTKHRKGKEIIYFDPEDNGLKTLKKTEHMKGLLRYKTCFLVCLRGCLCLYFRAASLDKKTAFRVWMKEKGRDSNVWSELMMVQNFEKPRGVRRIRPVHLFEDDKILIQIDGRRGFVIYSPLEKTFEKMEDIDPLCGFKLVPCPESLLFPALEDLSPRKRKREEIMN